MSSPKGFGGGGALRLDGESFALPWAFELLFVVCRFTCIGHTVNQLELVHSHTES